jgi:hypothetical protein
MNEAQDMKNMLIRERERWARGVEEQRKKLDMLV